MDCRHGSNVGSIPRTNSDKSRCPVYRQAWEARERTVQKRAITERAPLSQTIGGRAWTIGDESRPARPHTFIDKALSLSGMWVEWRRTPRAQSENLDYPGVVIIIDCVSGYYHSLYYITVTTPVQKFHPKRSYTIDIFI